MLYSLNLAFSLLILLFGGLAQGAVHGVVVFSRHGDRTSKFFPPTHLTTLGQEQLYNSGAFYRSRYINSNSSSLISGISTLEIVPYQLYAAAPDQNLLVNSGQAFLQGLYPPLSDLSPQGFTETLANGITVAPPLSGYQYATIHTISTSDPSTIWLKGDDNCPRKAVAGANFYLSELYTKLEASTKDFYESFSDILGGMLTRTGMGYINAYPIFDYINVGMIYNETIAKRVTATELLQLRTLADSQQWALNGNITSVKTPGVLPISGRTLASKILMQLSSIIDSDGKNNKFSLFLGSYDTFLSFFALSQLPNADKNFRGLPDYGSTMAFELISYLEDGTFPRGGDGLFVRFLFRNGTGDANDLREYPLFGNPRAGAVMAWADFRDAMAGITVSTVSQWCGVCGATETFCSTDLSTKIGTTDARDSQPLSLAVAGVIGAICALAAVGVAMALAMVFFGVPFSKSWKTTRERRFRGGEKLGSVYNLQETNSTDKKSNGGVNPPDKIYTQ